MVNTLKMLTSWLSNIHLNSSIYGLVNSETFFFFFFFSVLIQHLYGRVLGMQTFTLLSL